MKTIGLIGGMSWESTLDYYRIINQAISERLGGFNSAKCAMYSVNFAEVEANMSNERWDKVAEIISAAAKGIEKCGADFILICSNTINKVADDVQKECKIPILHIVDATMAGITSQKLKRIGLLGTRFTMEGDFYKKRITEKFNVEVIIPSKPERDEVDHVIFKELVHGEILPASRASYKQIMENMVEQGAEGIILGCTEIGSLVKEEDCRVPLFDTTILHAMAAVELALKA